MKIDMSLMVLFILQLFIKKKKDKENKKTKIRKLYNYETKFLKIIESNKEKLQNYEIT